MKRTHLLFVILFLAACAPAAPVVPTSTAIPAASTNPATATPAVVEPTATALPPTATASPARVDFDYAVIPGSETTTDINGYPISIAVHENMSSKMGDIEFSDPSAIADLYWDAKLAELQGHNPDAVNMTRQEFESLVQLAKAGDLEAQKKITSMVPVNDLGDDLGYQPLPKEIIPFINFDRTRIILVDPAKMKNISSQGRMGDRYSFNYYTNPDTGEVEEIWYVSASWDNFDWDKCKINIALQFATLPRKAFFNDGSDKYPSGNGLSKDEKKWSDEWMSIITISKITKKN